MDMTLRLQVVRGPRAPVSYMCCSQFCPFSHTTIVVIASLVLPANVFLFSQINRVCTTPYATLTQIRLIFLDLFREIIDCAAGVPSTRDEKVSATRWAVLPTFTVIGTASQSQTLTSSLVSPPQWPCRSIAPPLGNFHFHTDSAKTVNKETILPLTTDNILARELGMATEVCADASFSLPSRLPSLVWFYVKSRDPRINTSCTTSTSNCDEGDVSALCAVFHPLPNVKQSSISYSNPPCVDLFKASQPRARFSNLLPPCQFKYAREIPLRIPKTGSIPIWLAIEHHLKSPTSFHPVPFL